MISFVEELMIGTGIPYPDLIRIIESAPSRYKVYPIPKRGGGQRWIAHPARELKALQRYLHDRYLSRFPVHKSAMAYSVGRNIYDNAKAHSGAVAILKLDFSDFFFSIVTADWRKFLRDNPGVFTDKESGFVSTQLLFWGAGGISPNCLSIGAPSSPILSNIMLHSLDTRISDAAESSDVIYTRYADDITLSANSRERLLAFEKVVKKEVDRLKYPTLRFNDNKRGVYLKGERQMVTGLILTPDGKVSLGRARKRKISSLLFKAGKLELSVEEKMELKGFLAFSVATEPDFLSRLRAKYGDQLVEAAMKFRAPERT